MKKVASDYYNHHFQSKQYIKYKEMSADITATFNPGSILRLPANKTVAVLLRYICSISWESGHGKVNAYLF
jgi:hypothetical protein